MKLCIPVADGEGLEARVSGHFGSAPYYALVDTDTARVTMVKNDHQSHGGCAQVGRLRRHQIDGVVCSNMGRRAYGRFRADGIEVYTSERETLSQVLEEYRAGTLRQPSEDEMCMGHDHGYGEGRGHHHGEGHGHEHRHGGGGRCG